MKGLAALALGIFAVLGGLTYWVWTTVPLPAEGEFIAPVDPTRKLPQGDFFVGNFPPVRHLNPFTTRSQVALAFVLRYTHDCLLRLDHETGELRSAVARVVASSPDGLSHTFALTDGVTFSDGAPVTVGDIRFTLDASRADGLAAGVIASAVAEIAGFEALDSRRFRIQLKRRHFNALADMATSYRVVQRRWFVAQVAARAAAAGQPVPTGPEAPDFGRWLKEVQTPGPGTGPYQLAQRADGTSIFTPGQPLWLVQNLGSWQRREFPELWNLAGLGLRFLDAAAAERAFEKEEIDWHLPMNPAAFVKARPEVEKRCRLYVYDSSSLGHFYLAWNGAKLPDPRVRRALTMLVDRSYLKDEVLGGAAILKETWFRAPDPVNRSVAAIPFDPPTARKLLAEAGWGEERRLRLRVIAAVTERNRRFLSVIGDAFRRAGIELEAQLLEPGTLADRREKRDYEGLLAYWRHPPGAIDPYEMFHSRGTLNESGYQNDDVDRWLAEAQTTLETSAREALYRRVVGQLAEDQPVTILLQPRNALLLHRRFRNAEPGWSGAIPARWWVPAAEQLYKFARSR